MTRLSKEQVLKEMKTNKLSLDHRALSDVSCLAEFKDMERLDLAFNSLTSLEGLEECVNLKWLSVKQNKLQSLKGIEGLTMLAVLDAGKNKLTSLDEVNHLASLRALILNDNQIVSIGKFDQMKNLDTLVLSRNPISEIGDSLVNVKSITKISLSNCQIQNISASLKSCTELEELRLAHNDIKSLPLELSYNTKLQILDLGNNLISKVSELKVLESLVNLKNLNLKGNPVAEKDNLVKKVKKLLPNLQIFNAKPIDRATKNEEHKTAYVSPFTTHEHDKVEAKKDRKRDLHPDNATEEESIKKKKGRKAEEKEPKKKGNKADDKVVKDIDDSETPFAELFTTNVPEDADVRDAQSVGGLVTYPVKKKKNKKGDQNAALDLAPTVEIGLGGPSAWGED